MKRLQNYLIIISILAALTSCSKVENGSLDPVDLKSTAVYCNVNGGDFFSSYALGSGGIVANGWVLVRNDANFLNLYLKPSSGFQNLTDNIDIGFYSGALPTNSIPDVEGLHYHFTTGSIDPSIGFQVDLPINNVFIENLQAFSSLNCGEPIYMIIHYDALDELGHSIDVWTGSIQVEGSYDGTPWFYKYLSYTPACCITCTGETAWAAGNRYVSQGNWATYTPYSRISKSVTLFAGQTYEAGIVYFTPAAGGVNIRITLNEGFSLQDGTSVLHIQGYNVAPVGNPSPGKFKTYFGNSLDVTVPVFNFYGVHVNVLHCTQTD